MYHNALFKRNADKAAAFVKPLQVRIGYAYALIFTHELTDGSCIGCDELNVAELIGAEQMVKHFKKIVILIDRERHGAELIKAYVELSKKYKPSAIFIGATANGRDFAPHFAACLETGCTSDATELIYNPETTDIEFVEPAAGGKIMAVITIPVLRPQVGTIRPGTFKYVPTGKKAEFELVQEHIDFDPTKIRTKLVEYKANEFDPELDIASCDTIVCVGNGVKDESLPKYKELAKLLGGKLAGTRPVCDRELLPVKLQVGQSGVMIKPKLYIGFGVSGAVNHVTGVDAEKFIAVNKDASAPIFNYCDYGIVGDMDEVCDAMIAMLKN